MIEQQNGSLYLNNGAESGLLETNTMNSFMDFTRFFTDYGFVLEANFLNRFRSGEMPIGISNFTTLTISICSRNSRTMELRSHILELWTKMVF